MRVIMLWVWLFGSLLMWAYADKSLDRTPAVPILVMTSFIVGGAMVYKFGVIEIHREGDKDDLRAEELWARIHRDQTS